MNWHVESNYSPKWKELRFGTCLNQSISLDFFLFIKRGEKTEYWSLCLKLCATTLSLWWYRGRLTSFALCSCIKYRDVLQTFRAQGISTVWLGDIFLCFSLFVFDFLWEKICHEATLQYLEGADIVIGGKVLFLLVSYTSIAIERFSQLLEKKLYFHMISKSQL